MYQVQLTQKSLSNKAAFCQSAQFICENWNMNLSEICVGKSFAVMRISRLRTFLLEWLDFALKTLLSNGKCDLTLNDNRIFIFAWTVPLSPCIYIILLSTFLGKYTVSILSMYLS